MEAAQSLRASLSSLRTPVKRVSNDDLRNMPGGKAVVEAREAADNARRKARQAILRGADARRKHDITKAAVSSATRASSPKQAHTKSSAISAPALRQPPTPSTILKANVRRQQEQKLRRQEVQLQQQRQQEQLRERQAARRAALSTPASPPRAATAAAKARTPPPRPKQKRAEANVSRSLYKPEGKLTLSDLCDEDKSKVAHLLAQAVHSAEAKKSVAEAKDREKDWAAQADTLRKQNKDVIEENAALKSKLSNAFSLLKVYQKKIRGMLDLNQKMQMDHNVAIVQLHKRYEDLERMTDGNDTTATAAAAAAKDEEREIGNPKRTMDATSTINLESATASRRIEKHETESHHQLIDGMEAHSHQQKQKDTESEKAVPSVSHVDGAELKDDAVVPTPSTSTNVEATPTHVDVATETSLPDIPRASETQKTSTASAESDETRRENGADAGVSRVYSSPDEDSVQPVLRFNPNVGQGGLFYYSPTGNARGSAVSATAAGRADSFGSPVLGGGTAVDVANDLVANIPTGWNTVRRDALDVRVFDKSLVDIVERVEEHARESALFGEEELGEGDMTGRNGDGPTLGDIDTAILLRDIAQLPEVSDFFCTATARPHSNELSDNKDSSARGVEQADLPSNFDKSDNEDQMLTALLNGRSFDLQ